MKGTLNVIGEVVARNVCSGCGICAGLCPAKALVMGGKPNGDLVAQLSGKCREGCSLCLKVCPFTTGIFDPRPLNEKSFGPSKMASDQKNFREETGFYDSCVVGYSDDHRETSASGGLCTYLLEQLLRAKIVDRVAVVARQTDDSNRLFAYKSVSSIDELRQCSGSAYYQVPISDLIPEVMAEKTSRWAIMAVPCLAAAIRKASLIVPRLHNNIKYVFGLVCGQYQNVMYTEFLSSHSGIDPKDIRAVDYRIKTKSGPAHNFCFQAESYDGVKGRLVPYNGLPSYLGWHGYFRINSCNHCMDVFAEAADACFMDAWISEYLGDPRGTSFVIVRDHTIHRFLFGIQPLQSTIHVASVPIGKIITSQRFHVIRKQHCSKIRQKSKLQLRTNEIGLYFQWWLQKITQQRSKMAWRFIGRKWGIKYFWIAMTDLVVLSKCYSIAIRLMRKLRKKLKRS